MKIFENIINHKMNTITPNELMKYAQQFNVKVDMNEAKKVAQYLNGKQINLFDDEARKTLIKEIAKVAGPETARQVNQLFMQFVKSS